MSLLRRNSPQSSNRKCVRKTRVPLLIILLWSGFCSIGYIFALWHLENPISPASLGKIDNTNIMRRHQILHTTQSTNTVMVLKPWNCTNCFQWKYEVLLNQKDLCHVQIPRNQTVDVIFLIPSTHRGRARRDAIRDTWASVTHNNTARFRRVFFFGVTKDARRMREVEEESRHFRDMVMFRFEDSYRNLTLKTLMMLRWVTEQCSNARYFLKVDDDVWVNTKALLTTLTDTGQCLRRAIGGRCTMITTVIRNPRHKWGVSYEEYPASTYPQYCGGAAYVGAVSVAREVVRVSRDVPFFFLEDVFVGLCLRQLGYPVLSLGGFHKGVPGAVKSHVCHVWDRGVVTVLKASPNTLRQYWSSAACGSGAS